MKKNGTQRQLLAMILQGCGSYHTFQKQGNTETETETKQSKEEKSMLTINGIEPGEIRLPHFPGPIVEWPFSGVL